MMLLWPPCILFTVIKILRDSVIDQCVWSRRCRLLQCGRERCKDCLCASSHEEDDRIYEIAIERLEYGFRIYF